MADINEIIIRITGDDDDASNKLERFAALLESMDDLEANPSVDVDTGKARAQLDSFAIALRNLRDAHLNLDLETTGVFADLALVGTALQSLPDPQVTLQLDDNNALSKIAGIAAAGQALERQKLEIDANVKEAAALGKLGILAAAITAVDAKDVDIDVDVDRGGGLRGVMGLFSGLTRAGGALSEVLGSVGGNFSRMGVSIGPFTTALNPATLAVIALVFALGTLLVGALLAVVASAAAAAAGVAALGIAFAAAFGPAVLVAIAVIARLAKVFEALKAQDAAAQQQAQEAARHHDEARQAEQARADAARALGRAEEDLARATSAAYREMADAAERARDSVLGLAQAHLTEEQAALNIDKAKLALEKFRNENKLTSRDLDDTFKKFTDVNFDPDKLNAQLQEVGGDTTLGKDKELELKQLILDIKQARQSQRQATDGVSDAQTTLSRATSDYNDYVRQGIRANPGYIAALRAREDAQRALQRANENQDKILASQANAKVLTEKLSASEQRLVTILKQARTTFGEVFGGATESLINSIGTAIEIVATRAAPLRDVFTGLGDAMGKALITLVTGLTSPEMIDGFTQMIDLGGQLSGPIVDGLVSLAGILMDLATTAGPYLVPIFQGLADALAGLAGKTDDTQLMADIIAFLVSNVETWWYLAVQLARVVIAFFKDGASEGQNFVKWLGDGAKHLADLLDTKEGRDQVKQWLKDAVDFAKDFAVFIFQTMKFLIRLGGIAYTIYNNIRNVVNAINGFLQGADRFFSRIVDRLNRLDDGFSAWVKNLVPQIASALSGLFHAGVDIAGSIIKGLVNGFLHPEAFFKAASGLAKKGIGVFKKVFGIGSPSKVTAVMGVELIRGLEVGLNSAGTRLGRVAEVTMARPILSAIPTTVGVPPGAGGAEGGAGGPETYIDKVVLPPAPGGGLGDERAAAEKFTRELRRRGH